MTSTPVRAISEPATEARETRSVRETVATTAIISGVVELMIAAMPPDTQRSAV